MKSIIYKTGVVILCLISIITFCSCEKTDDENCTTEIQSDVDINEIELSEKPSDLNGIQIVGVSPYSGPFFEDGNDENCNDVSAVRLYNSTDKTLRYMTFHASFVDGTVMNYTITTLPAHEYCTVLESGKQNYIPINEVASWSCADDEFVFFDKTPSVMTDVFSFSGAQEIINVSNNSDYDVADIAVYYKNTVDGELFGGITYRTTISDGIKAGGLVQASAKHFNIESSRIMFVMTAESASQSGEQS